MPILTKTCSIENCEGPVVAHGWCRKHYSRWHKNGDPLKLRGYFSKHDASFSPEYRAWIGMKSRCYNANTRRYSRYGGRGIKVCVRWLDSFESFLYDMGPRPTPQHSIDRKDVNGDYDPSNCRWATKAQQSINRDVGIASSRFRGVRWDKERLQWAASISTNSTGINVGRYDNELEAAWMYD